MITYTKKQIAALDQYYRHPRNLVDLFQDSAAAWGDRNLFGTKDPATGRYTWVTYRQIAERIDRLRAGINRLGFKKGETIGVIIGNSAEWFIIENATHGLGGCFVPMYEKELPKTWQYIVKDSGIKYLFVKNQQIYEQVKPLQRKIPGLKKIFIIYGDGAMSLSALEETGAAYPCPSYKPHWAETAELIYTSGTTGEPKGVVLSHGNLCACSQSGYHIFPELNQDSVSLSILPWAHSYGLSAELHNFIQFGGSMGIMESVETLAADMLAVRPTYLIAVPRVFNKIYDAIHAAVNEEGGVKKALFDLACREARRCRDTGPSLLLKIMDRLVFSKIRAKFGGRLTGTLTASACMNPDIALFFKDLGLPTYDAYGMTETAPAITMNSPLKGNRYGSVGRPVENMHVVIDRSRTGEDSEDGEIIAYGAHVMRGYHHKPKETAAIMMPDTWMGFPGVRTGDRGRLDADGYLFITGRFKDEYKLTNGKYVHPESMETDIKLHPAVANAMVYGDGRPFNICIVVPDFAGIKKVRELASIAMNEPRELVGSKKFTDYLSGAIVKQLEAQYLAYEIPRKFLFIEQDFTLENGMLTQTMKLKRREVFKRYAKAIEDLYRK